MSLTNEKVRLLYLPNEGSCNGKQIEGRTAFETLLAAGELAAYEVFSFWDELEACGDPGQADLKLLDVVVRFQPTLVLWQHPTRYPVAPAVLDAIKRQSFRPLLVYDERDPYVRGSKPLPSGARVLSRFADVVFSTGLGDKVDLFRNAGARRVYYSPTCMDVERFSAEWTPAIQPAFDVVMIASLCRFNVPFLRLPGSRERVLLADKLWKRLGDRFAVFGHYWPRRPYVHGPLPFEHQTATMQKGLVSVGWDRFATTPYYFSDRLPIAMMSGVPHVTNYKPGFDQLFRNGMDLFYGRTIDDVVDTVMYLLSLPREELVRIGRQQRDYAVQNLAAVPVFRNLLLKACEERRMLLGKE